MTNPTPTPEHAQLRAQGVPDDTIAQAQAFGLGGGFLLSLVKRYGPLAIDVLKELLGNLQPPQAMPAGQQKP